MSDGRIKELTVKLREVFGDKNKLRFIENTKGIITGLGLLSLAGGDYKHSHLKKIDDQAELKLLMKEFGKSRFSLEKLAKEKSND